MAYREVFERVEKKYLIREEQYEALMARMGERLTPDAWGESTVCNLYYDTPSYRLIRASLEQPAYKEKLRLRCYGAPDDATPSFLEIKKKYNGIVYKRRIALPYLQGQAYLGGGPKTVPEGKEQIARELDWFLRFYGDLAPRMAICYDRQAFFDSENDALRITFDRKIRWRTDTLDLRRGSDGRMLLPDGICLMELKIPGALPLWMVRALEETDCYPTRFSKYGKAYTDLLTESLSQKNDLFPDSFRKELPRYA